MTTISQAMQAAAGELQRISEANSGGRRQRAAAVALVLRTLESSLDGSPASRFSRLRAENEAAGLQSGADRAILLRLLRIDERLPDPAALAALVDLLVDYAYELEVTRRLSEAEAVITLARSLAPESATVSLHAGRIARKQGRRAEALGLYRAARELDAGDGGLGRLARIGEAVVSADPLPALGAALRDAVLREDAEAAAVALEERARIRRQAGDRAGAARDLCIAAARFVDPVDRARVAHELADLFTAVGDPLAVREALLLALSVGDASQREHAQARLHAVSRDLQDQVGARRWRSFQRPALVSLSAARRPTNAPSAAPRLARWRDQLEAITAQI